MPHLIKLVKLGTAASLALVLSGCVSAEEFAKVRLERDQYAEQVAHSQTEINEANARADAANKQLNAVGNNNGTESAMLANMQQQNADLQKQNDDWSRRYNEAMALIGTSKGGEPLGPALTDALTTFANQNPDLIEFDAARGVVKFKSDVTFPVGDATVTPKAKEVLAHFSSILNSSGGDGYELLVAGHTDSTPVTNEATKRRGNFNNWYLSAHRAISVGSELIADGVSAKRMGVVGYADERPIASNATEAGKAQNRRVEVLILPTSLHVGGGTSSVASIEPKPRHTGHTAAAEAVPARAKLDKDTASTFNK
jgi:flagellar motor protein MotB